MYKLNIDREISISHRLMNHNGKCHNLHGHNFKIHVCVQADELIEDGSSDGMVIDFGTVKNYIDLLDHKDLNDYFECTPLEYQPTAERIAKYLATQIMNVSENPSIFRIDVDVYETANNMVTYTLMGE